MARGRAKWKRYFEPKTYLGPAFSSLETVAPSVTSLIGYHSLLRFPRSGFERYDEIRIPSRLTEAPYDSIFQALSANVDHPSGQLGHAGHNGRPGETSTFGPLKPLETRAVSAVASNVVVPGHILLPADHETGRLLSLYQEGRLPWGHVYVAPSRLRQERVPGYAWAIPRVANYYHLMVEHILPALDLLLRERQHFAREPISVITTGRRELLDYLLACMGRFGLDVKVVQSNPYTTYRPDHYLFCHPVSATTEHFHAYRPAVELIRDDLLRSGTVPLTERLYIPRTGTRIRRLVGEERMIEALEARGFHSFVAKWSNVPEQFARFMGAREIISVHGAALTNVMWSPPEARVVELFSSSARKTTYLHIASQHGLDYAFALGGREDERQAFSIDTEAVLAKLQ